MTTLAEPARKELAAPLNFGETDSIAELARLKIQQDERYTPCFRDISCSFDQGVLILQGRVPSFYVKQVLQTVVKDIAGVEQIDNQVDVVSSTGLSSVRSE